MRILLFTILPFWGTSQCITPYLPCNFPLDYTISMVTSYADGTTTTSEIYINLEPGDVFVAGENISYLNNQATASLAMYYNINDFIEPTTPNCPDEINFTLDAAWDSGEGVVNGTNPSIEVSIDGGITYVPMVQLDSFNDDFDLNVTIPISSFPLQVMYRFYYDGVLGGQAMGIYDFDCTSNELLRYSGTWELYGTNPNCVQVFVYSASTYIPNDDSHVPATSIVIDWGDGDTETIPDLNLQSELNHCYICK